MVSTFYAEYKGTPEIYNNPSISMDITDKQSGGNMEGKEVRFGVTNSAIWGVTTTSASNGSVNSMHDSFTPIGGMALTLLMQLGEVKIRLIDNAIKYAGEQCKIKINVYEKNNQAQFGKIYNRSS